MGTDADLRNQTDVPIAATPVFYIANGTGWIRKVNDPTWMHGRSQRYEEGRTLGDIKLVGEICSTCRDRRPELFASFDAPSQKAAAARILDPPALTKFAKGANPISVADAAGRRKPKRRPTPTDATVPTNFGAGISQEIAAAAAKVPASSATQLADEIRLAADRAGHPAAALDSPLRSTKRLRRSSLATSSGRITLPCEEEPILISEESPLASDSSTARSSAA